MPSKRKVFFYFKRANEGRRREITEGEDIAEEGEIDLKDLEDMRNKLNENVATDKFVTIAMSLYDKKGSTDQERVATQKQMDALQRAHDQTTSLTNDVGFLIGELKKVCGHH